MIDTNALQPYIAAGIAYYGLPLLDYIRGRIGDELHGGVETAFSHLAKRLPWKKSPKSDSLAGTQTEIADILQADPALNEAVQRDLAQLIALCPQLPELIKAYAATHMESQQILNQGATIGKQTNIQQVQGDVTIN